ncbi:hypothetical protein [Nonomuraea sp. NPDC050310]|uniref:hypothetical protein n=1 Tax=Nonomuraea sp. NPDC050310 TaxID=3154935 RepID=UPI0034007161
MPSDFFDDLRRSLDEPPQKNQALADLAALNRKVKDEVWTYQPPVISRNVAELLGIPLSDPDVEQEVRDE